MKLKRCLYSEDLQEGAWNPEANLHFSSIRSLDLNVLRHNAKFRTCVLVFVVEQEGVN